MKLYFDCTENQTQPFPGPVTQQSALVSEIFAYIDGVVNLTKLRQYKLQKAEASRIKETPKR